MTKRKNKKRNPMKLARLARVERRQWAASHSDPLEFHGNGIGYWGRYSWTYP